MSLVIQQTCVSDADMRPRGDFMAAVLSQNVSVPEQLAGSFHTFGPTGPAYQVRRPVCALTGGDWLMEIEVLASGEVLEYKASEIDRDPVAA